ncbi:MAG: PfkB family carbohydrate kinase [Gemmataceae bacterium]
MLTEALIERVLEAAPRLRIGVLGDLFLDRYFDLDARLTEPSIETGLDAYQVFRIRNYPGAAGTVINNLSALGVGAILPISVIGDDGEGLELSRCLLGLSAVRAELVFSSPQRFTPTYAKPMLCAGQTARELNRIDIKNRARLPVQEEGQVIDALERVWPHLDALAVLDQVSEEDCGVVTTKVRAKLAELAMDGKPVLADSRERIGLFHGCMLKPNEAECRKAVGASPTIGAAAQALACRVGRPVFCTCGAAGILVADPERGVVAHAPAYEVTAPIDPVGAGDSTSAGILCALAAGVSCAEAAAFGALVASITIQQIGVTGTATPEQVRARWREVGV